jgi:hypothetical protein
MILAALAITACVAHLAMEYVYFETRIAEREGRAPKLPKNPFRRPPDVVIGGSDRPYMLRWWVIPRNRLLNIYLHKFFRSDDERAMHDHPWPSISILVRGQFWEHLADGRIKQRVAPAIIFRRATAAHRIELIRLYKHSCNHPEHNPDGPPITIFITGPKCREWGFLCPQGWRHWKEFTAGHDPRTGQSRGCGES